MAQSVSVTYPSRSEVPKTGGRNRGRFGRALSTRALVFTTGGHHPRSRLVRYGVAVLAAVLGTLVRQLLAPVLQSTVPYITFFPAVAFSAAFGGFYPGLWTTILGAFAARYFVIAPLYSLSISNLADGLGLLLYLGVGTLICHLMHAVETERHVVRQGAERLHLAQDAAGFAVWDWNIRTGDVVWSPELYEFCGLDAESIVPSFQRWLQCIHPDDREHVEKAAQNAVEQRHALGMEARILRPDGSIRWLLIRAKVFSDASGAPARMVSVNLDVTDRKRGEEELRTLNEELRKTNAELEQYTFAASHDLQEPLRLLSLYSQMLMKRYRESFDHEAQIYFDYIQTAARRMQSLISDLLSYSRLIAEMDRHFLAVDLNEVVRAAEESSIKALHEAGGTLVYEPLPVVQGEFHALRAVFENLLSNAIKFRKAEDAPVIRISSEAQDTEWRFAVQDNGTGIAKDYHERIFGIFRRLHTSEVPGTGMGLAVCKKVVEQHRGRIWVKSEPGNGSIFYFTLPR